MRIGLFTHVYSPMVNGVAVSTKVLEDELRNQGHDVFVITNNYNGLRNDFTYEENLKVTSIPIYYQNLRTPVLYNRELMKKLAQLKLDVVHSHSDFGLGVISRTYAYKNNIPHIQTYHCNYIGYAKTNFGKVLGKLSEEPVKLYSKYLCNFTDRIISPSEENYRLLKDKFNIKRDIDIIPNGLNLNKFQATDESKTNELKQQFNIQNDDFVLLSLSRLSKEKRIDQIIKAISYLKECKNLKLLIVGGGPDESRLKQLVDSLNLPNVIFTGEVNNNEVQNYYKLATSFITNSNAETQGLTVIESLASQVPVICLNDPLYEDIVKEHYNGIKYDDEDDLIRTIRELYNNREYLERLKQNTENSVQDYSIKSTSKKIVDLYDKEIEAKQKCKTLNR